MRSLILVFVVVVWITRPAVATEPSDLHYVLGSTEKVCQLTGDFDRGLQKPTLSQTATRYGVLGTDLGSTFEHEGRLYFLFGDTIGQPGDWDAVAWTESTDPEKIVLDFHRDADRQWLPPRVPGIEQGAFEIPSGGASVDGMMYVVFTTDHSEKKTMGRSVLASSTDDGRTFKTVYDLSRDNFINISIVAADGWLYIYGSGEYRKSSVYLARVRPGDIRDRSKLRYFAGTDPDGKERWVTDEAIATPLFHHEVVGEFSVTYLEPVKRYVMLYNSNKSSEPRGIIMRWAVAPTGVWSEGTLIFQPMRDEAFGRFMHMPTKGNGAGDELSDPDRDDVRGDPYGPYVMGRYTTGADGGCRIYYTLSTWNPYQVVVMRSDLTLGPPEK